MSKLDELKIAMDSCVACGLCDTRTQVVFGEGHQSPRIMLIGEGPGADEDYIGKPFVGRCGKKLDDILSYVGVTRDDIYITNAVLCRPPNNRNPNRDELQACRWRLLEQIRILNPELIIVLGKIAYEQLSGFPIKGALSAHFRDEFMEFELDDYVINLMVTYHPSYHLRSPDRAYKVTLPHWTMVKQWMTERLG